MKDKKDSLLKSLFRQYQDETIDQHHKKIIDQWFDRYEAEEFVDIISDPETAQRIYQELNDRIANAKTPTKFNRLWPKSVWLRAACSTGALCLVAGLFYRHLHTSNTTVPKVYNQVSTNNAQVKKIKLPDGTEIWLNAATHIRFATSFPHDQQRIVYLDKGEAFFRVTHHPDHPFSVISGPMITRDIGTAFNIRAYDLKDDYRVTVTSGEVTVTQSGKVEKSASLRAQLHAGQALFYNPGTHQTQVTRKDPSLINAWRSCGSLYFDELTLVQIGQELARHFNIRVNINQPDDCKTRYTINAANKNLDQVLQQLTSITAMSYKLDPNYLIINPPANK
jgi:transmembrane sensor